MIVSDFQSKLEAIKSDSPAKFGVMTPQHMIEHLILTVKLSYGRIKIPEFEPNEKQLSSKHILLYELAEFPKGIRAPGLSAEPSPLKFASLADAKSALIESQNEYDKFFSEFPAAKTMHPRFGAMTKDEWDIFHQKHFTHHLDQFS